MIVNEEEFGYRSLEVNNLNCSKSDKINFSLEFNMHIRFFCISLLEYLGTDSNLNK